jgi:hypothetical protein
VILNSWCIQFLCLDLCLFCFVFTLGIFHFVLLDIRSEGHLSLITYIPQGYLCKLISEIPVKEYNNESWQSWYNRTGSGQLLHQASTAVCILNEIIFVLSDQAVRHHQKDVS